jgi:hypothetical protein
MRGSLTYVVEASGESTGFVVPTLIGLWVALWLWSLVDVLSWPRATWDVARLSKARWVLRIAILGAFGACFYVALARRRLKAAYASVRWGR